MKNILIVVIVLILAVLGYRYMQPNTATIDSMASIDSTASPTDDTPAADTVTAIEFDDITPTYVDLGPDKNSVIESAPSVVTSLSFSCDGRQHCSQMTSCAEATYFSNNCPNTKMDGNNDGVPCEQQWCR